jgi:hypothetical protein
MPCASYRQGQLCSSGFPMHYPPSSACTGFSCMCCGKPNEVVPACQDENISSRWLNEDGTAKYAQKVGSLLNNT